MTAAARTWLAECYSPGIDRSDVALAEERARTAAAELRDSGSRIEYLGALLVPDDEVVFHAFTASDASSVREAGRLAGIRIDRVVEAETVDTGDAEGALGRLLPGAELRRPPR